MKNLKESPNQKSARFLKEVERAIKQILELDPDFGKPATEEERRAYWRDT